MLDAALFVHGSRLKAHGSRLKAHGSMGMASSWPRGALVVGPDLGRPRLRVACVIISLSVYQLLPWLSWNPRTACQARRLITLSAAASNSEIPSIGLQ